MAWRQLSSAFGISDLYMTKRQRRDPSDDVQQRALAASGGTKQTREPAGLKRVGRRVERQRRFSACLAPQLADISDANFHKLSTAMSVYLQSSRSQVSSDDDIAHPRWSSR